jgi:hypothetical protein
MNMPQGDKSLGSLSIASGAATAAGCAGAVACGTGVAEGAGSTAVGAAAGAAETGCVCADAKAGKSRLMASAAATNRPPRKLRRLKRIPLSFISQAGIV